MRSRLKWKKRRTDWRFIDKYSGLFCCACIYCEPKWAFGVHFVLSSSLPCPVDSWVIQVSSCQAFTVVSWSRGHLLYSYIATDWNSHSLEKWVYLEKVALVVSWWSHLLRVPAASCRATCHTSIDGGDQTEGQEMLGTEF